MFESVERALRHTRFGVEKPVSMEKLQKAPKLSFELKLRQKLRQKWRARE